MNLFFFPDCFVGVIAKNEATVITHNSIAIVIARNEAIQKNKDKTIGNYQFQNKIY